MKLPLEDTAKEIIPKVYDDLVHTGASQTGQAVGGLLRFVALPFKFLGLTAEELEIRYQRFISRAINRVPEDKRIMPKASIASPLLEHVKYAFEESDLQELFERLLASTVDKESASKVQPSFLYCVKNMNERVAKILKAIAATNGGECFCSAFCHYTNATGEKSKYEKIFSAFSPSEIGDYFEDKEEFIDDFIVLERDGIIERYDLREHQVIDRMSSRYYETILHNLYSNLGRFRENQKRDDIPLFYRSKDEKWECLLENTIPHIKTVEVITNPDDVYLADLGNPPDRGKEYPCILESHFQRMEMEKFLDMLHNKTDDTGLRELFFDCNRYLFILTEYGELLCRALRLRE